MVDEFTTHFRTYFSGLGPVHWVTGLDFDPPFQDLTHIRCCPRSLSPRRGIWAPVRSLHLDKTGGHSGCPCTPPKRGTAKEDPPKTAPGEVQIGLVGAIPPKNPKTGRRSFFCHGLIPRELGRCFHMQALGHHQLHCLIAF